MPCLGRASAGRSSMTPPHRPAVPLWTASTTKVASAMTDVRNWAMRRAFLMSTSRTDVSRSGSASAAPRDVGPAAPIWNVVLSAGVGLGLTVCCAVKIAHFGFGCRSLRYLSRRDDTREHSALRRARKRHDGGAFRHGFRGRRAASDGRASDRAAVRAASAHAADPRHGCVPRHSPTPRSW